MNGREIVDAGEPAGPLDTVPARMGRCEGMHGARRVDGDTMAAETFQSDQAFGTLANRLMVQGLIERRPGHGRRIEHRLTLAGEVVLMAGHPASNAILGASFADLSEQERVTLLGLLHRVTTRALDLG